MKPVGYYKFVILSNELKARHKIKIGATVPRYDCIKFTGEYEGMTAFINSKGMFMLYLMDSNRVIKADSRRLSEFVLKGIKSLNFSSLYFEDISSPNLCYGYPNGKPLLSNGVVNPLFQFRQDLYLMIMKEDFTVLEVLVFKDQIGFAGDYLQNLVSGEFDEVLTEMRNRSQTFFNYGEAV